MIVAATHVSHGNAQERIHLKNPKTEPMNVPALSLALFMRRVRMLSNQVGSSTLSVVNDGHLCAYRWSGEQVLYARLWDLTANEPDKTARVLRGHRGYVRAVAISSDNRWLARYGTNTGV